MKKLVIGIIGVAGVDDENDSLIALYDNYRKMAVEKDFIPFMISPFNDIDYAKTDIEKIPELTTKEKEMYKEMVDMCDGLIIPGGYNIYPYQEYIINYALDKDIPILGTCLGMQILANMDNGFDCLLEDETLSHKKRDEQYVHDIKIMPNTLLSSIINENEIKVNSIHKYYVSKVNNLIVSAYATDGKIEAIEHPDKRFVLGLQWHPEKMIKYDQYANKIIDRFIKESKNKVR